MSRLSRFTQTSAAFASANIEKSGRYDNQQIVMRHWLEILMTLQSNLFSGDEALEAAAVSDTAHILPESYGAHVVKIQTALAAIDGVEIRSSETSTGHYGPSTAAAVLSFKTTRNIVNRAYQTKPDNIVGRMTIARLDVEMAAYERSNRKALTIRPLSPMPQGRPVAPRAEIVSYEVKGKTMFNAMPTIGALRLKPSAGIELVMGQSGTFEVSGGIDCIVDTTDRIVAMVYRPDQPNAHYGQFVVERDPQMFAVKAFNWGSAMIVAHRKNSRSLFDTEYLRLTIKDPRGTVNKSKKTDAHNHMPCQNCWSQICDNPSNRPINVSSTYLWLLAKAHASPRTVVNQAKLYAFSDKPIGLAHLNHYLTGHGVTVNEDRNLDNWIRTDSAARRNIADEIRLKRNPSSVQVRTTIEFDQEMFGDQDYRYAFGTIDFLDIEADFVANTVTLWFEDRYEWHPSHPQFQPRCPNLKIRDTNFLHAALVQMKLEGAADYWMRGEVTFPLSLFPI